MSHLEDQKMNQILNFHLVQIPLLETLINKEVMFCSDCIDHKSFEVTKKLSPGQVVLLENLRFYSEEKLGNKDFAYKLSKHGDVYVNDAFGTAHLVSLLLLFFFSR